MSEPFVAKVRIVTDFLNSIGNLDFDAAGRHLAKDAVMVLPFLDGLAPVHGMNAIVDQLRTSIPQMFERMDFTFDQWYDARDTGALIAEYHSECPQKGTGAVYKNSYITVFRFEDEKISLYKEYLNPARLFAALPPDGPAADNEVQHSGQAATPSPQKRSQATSHPGG